MNSIFFETTVYFLRFYELCSKFRIQQLKKRYIWADEGQIENRFLVDMRNFL